MGNVRHQRDIIVSPTRPTDVPEKMEKQEQSGWSLLSCKFLRKLGEELKIWSVLYRQDISEEVERQRQRHSKPMRRFYGAANTTEDTN